HHLVLVLADVALSAVGHELVSALLDVNGAEPVGVEPVLEPVDVPIGGDLAGSSVYVRKVGIDPFGGRLRLADDDGPESADGRDQCERKDQVHERDCKAAGNAKRPDQAHERIQEQRDQQRDEEEEDDVTHGARDHPEKEQQHRQADELDPARNDGLRRGRGHSSDRSAEVVQLRPPSWDWSWAEDGALALDLYEVWEERPVQSRFPVSQIRPRTRWTDPGPSVTVPRMPAPSDRAVAVRR